MTILCTDFLTYPCTFQKSGDNSLDHRDITFTVAGDQKASGEPSASSSQSVASIKIESDENAALESDQPKVNARAQVVSPVMSMGIKNPAFKPSTSTKAKFFGK